jgi:hypothetical protein
MRVQFVDKVNGPERLVCDAEVLFDEDPLAGMKLVGFSLWRSTDGDVYVTFPSRAFGAGTSEVLRLPALGGGAVGGGQAREGLDPRRVPRLTRGLEPPAGRRGRARRVPGIFDSLAERV